MADSAATAAPDSAEVGGRAHDSPAEGQKALRRRTVAFVIVFVASVLTLLIGYYGFMVPTRANDWYLFQVARTTSWLLKFVGHSCELGGAGRLQGEERRARAAIAAWARGERAPADAPLSDAAEPPLTAWEAWQYKSGTRRQMLADAQQEVARLKQDASLSDQERTRRLAEAETKLAQLRNHETGPLVSFIFRPGLATALDDARARLVAAKRDASLDAEARQRRIAEAEAEVARLEKTLTEARHNPNGLDPKLRDIKFSFVVIPDCGAIPSMAIFFSAVLAFPARWWKRLVGIGVGVPILYVVNAFRLAFLAVVGAWDSGGQWFKFSHEYVWQGIYIVFVVALWMSWVEFLVRRRTRC